MINFRSYNSVNVFPTPLTDQILRLQIGLAKEDKGELYQVTSDPSFENLYHILPQERKTSKENQKSRKRDLF